MSYDTQKNAFSLQYNYTYKEKTTLFFKTNKNVFWDQHDYMMVKVATNMNGKLATPLSLFVLYINEGAWILSAKESESFANSSRTMDWDPIEKEGYEVKFDKLTMTFTVTFLFEEIKATVTTEVLYKIEDGNDLEEGKTYKAILTGEEFTLEEKPEDLKFWFEGRADKKNNNSYNLLKDNFTKLYDYNYKGKQTLSFNKINKNVFWDQYDYMMVKVETKINDLLDTPLSLFVAFDNNKSHICSAKNDENFDENDWNYDDNTLTGEGYIVNFDKSTMTFTVTFLFKEVEVEEPEEEPKQEEQVVKQEDPKPEEPVKSEEPETPKEEPKETKTSIEISYKLGKYEEAEPTSSLGSIATATEYEAIEDAEIHYTPYALKANGDKLEAIEINVTGGTEVDDYTYKITGEGTLKISEEDVKITYPIYILLQDMETYELVAVKFVKKGDEYVYDGINKVEYDNQNNVNTLKEESIENVKADDKGIMFIKDNSSKITISDSAEKFLRNMDISKIKYSPNLHMETDGKIKGIADKTANTEGGKEQSDGYYTIGDKLEFTGPETIDDGTYYMLFKFGDGDHYLVELETKDNKYTVKGLYKAKYVQEDEEAYWKKDYSILKNENGKLIDALEKFSFNHNIPKDSQYGMYAYYKDEKGHLYAMGDAENTSEPTSVLEQGGTTENSNGFRTIKNENPTILEVTYHTDIKTESIYVLFNQGEKYTALEFKKDGTKIAEHEVIWDNEKPGFKLKDEEEQPEEQQEEAEPNLKLKIDIGENSEVRYALYAFQLVDETWINKTEWGYESTENNLILYSPKEDIFYTEKYLESMASITNRNGEKIKDGWVKINETKEITLVNTKSENEKEDSEKEIYMLINVGEYFGAIKFKVNEKGITYIEEGKTAIEWINFENKDSDFWKVLIGGNQITEAVKFEDNTIKIGKIEIAQENIEENTEKDKISYRYTPAQSTEDGNGSTEPNIECQGGDFISISIDENADGKIEFYNIEITPESTEKEVTLTIDEYTITYKYNNGKWEEKQ